MSQSIFTSINPATTSGNQLATILNGFKDAYVSGNSGTSRPSALQEGGTWVDVTNDPTSWSLKLYTGTTDIEMFTINLVSGVASVTTTDAMMTIVKSTDDAVGAILKFFKERPTANQTQTGDTLGKMDFYGNRDDDVQALQASIEVVSSDNVTSTAQGAYVVFKGTTDGTASVSEWMRLVDAKLGIGTNSPDETLHVKGTGIKAEKASDDAVGVKVVRKKKRIAGVGQVQSGDVISEESYNSTDNAGVDIQVAVVEVAATELHTSSAQGTSWKVKTKNNGSSSLTTKITVDNSGVDIPELKVGSVTNTEIGYLDGVTSAIQTQLDNKISTSQKGVANGVAPLESDGKIDAAYLPSYVDDVVEYADLASFPVTGTTGKIYVALDTNKTYRWTGSTYVEISSSLSDTLLSTNAFTLGTTRHFAANAQTDSTATGADATMSAFTAGVVRLTNASLTSLANIPAGTDGQMLLVTNRTGADITIKDQSDAIGTAGARIYTGEGASVTQKNNSTFSYVYDSTSSRWNLVGGTGSGSGQGGINYITNYNFEAGTTGYSTYADAAGTSPVDGTGGSANITFTRTTSSPLRGVGSGLITKDGFNRQGEGVSVPFTIDNSDKGKVLQIELEYQIASGTFADNDVTIWVYDITNSRLIQPAPYQIKNSTLIEKMGLEFQSSIDSTSYRLIFHVSSTSTSAYTIKVDNISVGPQAKLYGSPVTDWNSYTPTSSWTTNVSSLIGKWRRVGDTLEGIVTVTLNGANTQGSLSVTLPSGLSADTNKMQLAATLQEVGTVRVADASGSGFLSGVAVFSGTNSISALVHQLTAASANSSIFEDNVSSSANRPITYATGDSVTLQFKLPIIGWSSSLELSNDAATRVVTARATSSGTTATSGAITPVVFSVTEVDTHGAYNSSTGVFTVPVSGYYKASVSFTASASTTSTIDAFTNLFLQKNGVTYASIANFIPQTTSATTKALKGTTNTDFLTAGTQLRIVVDNPNPTFTGVNNTTGTWVTFERISGPSQIAASETVSASYYTSAGQSIPVATTSTVLFGTKENDSHNAYNTSTGIYTVPVSGRYSISATVSYAFTPGTVGNLTNVWIYKNGSALKRNLIALQTTSTSIITQPSVAVHSVQLLAGETIAIATNHDESGAKTLFTQASMNHFSIVRTGNY